MQLQPLAAGGGTAGSDSPREEENAESPMAADSL